MPGLLIKPVLSAYDTFAILQGHDKPQPMYLMLELDTGKAYATYSIMNNGAPMRVENGVDRRYSLPLMRPESINSLMMEVAPLLADVLSGAQVVWSGRSMTGGLIEQSSVEAEAAIIERLSRAQADLIWWDAFEWFENDTSNDSPKAMLRSGMTLEEVEYAHKQEGTADHPFLVNFWAYLNQAQSEVSGEDQVAE